MFQAWRFAPLGPPHRPLGARPTSHAGRPNPLDRIGGGAGRPVRLRRRGSRPLVFNLSSRLGAPPLMVSLNSLHSAID